MIFFRAFKPSPSLARLVPPPYIAKPHPKRVRLAF